MKRNANGEMSAAQILQLHPENIRPERKRQELPAIGQVILYNYLEAYSDTNGRRANEERGIGVVMEYTRHLIIIKKLRRPDLNENTTFRIADVTIGLLQYRKMSQAIYSGTHGMDGAFSYRDLAVGNPHPYISERFAN